MKLFVTCLLSLLSAATVDAHTLGVDPLRLTELADGRYELVSTIPQTLAYLIVAPELPEQCSLIGDPRGERGQDQIRFTFTCDQALSARDNLVLHWLREGVMLTVRWEDGTESTGFVARQSDSIRIDLALFQAGSGSWIAGAKRYGQLGFEHIWEGIDHLLFVFGLLLLVSNVLMLVKTITAFTVAHSITLALATLGFVNISTTPVEAAIALSIVFLAVEIVRGYQGRFSLTHRKPWLIAFGFGLLHGLGFAGALSDIGLPPGEVPLALLFFNIGVEIGQLIFVAVILAIYRILTVVNPVWPRWIKLLPAYALGIAAMSWTAERSVAIF